MSVPYLGNSPALISTLALALIVSGYCFAVSLPLGAIVGQRGLAPRGPVSNRLVYLGNAIASLATLVGWGLFAWLAVTALIGSAN